MSTSQVLTIVGGAIGFAITGTPIGFQIGALAGGVAGAIIDPPHFETPKVGDLKAPQVQYGAKLMRLYGSNRTAGVLAWYSDKRVIPGDGGGKGEPSQPTADTAQIDVLYILAVDSDIVGISRVWKNGELVFSRHSSSDSTTLSLDPTGKDWADMRFLDGNPNQLPDPTIEASEGVGNAPAYRDRQCVLIESLNLGQSGQLPLLEFECVTHASAAANSGPTRLLSYFTKSVPDSSQVWPSGQDMAWTLNFSIYKRDDPTGAPVPDAGPGWVENVEAGSLTTTSNGELLLGWPGAVSGDSFLARQWSYSDSTIGPDGTSPITIECIARFVEFTDPYLGTVTPQSVGIMRFRPNTSGSGAGHGDAYEFRYNAIGEIIYRDNISSPYTATSSPIEGRTHLAMVFSSTNFRAYIGGVKVLERVGDHTLPHVASAAAAVQFGAGSDLLGLWTLFGYEAPSADYRVDEFALRFEETYTGDRFAPPRHLKRPENDPIITPLPVDLSEIVSDEWMRVADKTQIDTSQLEGIPVRGFQSSGSVRGAVEALSQVFHFGGVCSNKLYIRRQGGAAVATPAFADLAAGEGKPADEPFAPERANDEEIPDRITLTYPNYSDDYANGTETGDRGTSYGTVSSAQTNVVMTPAEAKAVAETYAAQAGIAATTGQIALSDYYAPLEPTDRVIVPDEDGSLYAMRITRETYGGGVKVLDLVRDDVTTLIASGVTSAAYTQSLTVAPPADTEILLLDTAIVRDADDNPGFYAVAKGAGRSDLFESADNVTYALDATFSSQSVFGTCSTTLGDWTGGRVFDETSRVTVDVGAGTLASSTRAALLADQSVNACVIGVDGRWEMMQFRTASLVSAGIYTLSGFLRGARGTEWASTGHTSGEKFALLTTAARRVLRDASEIGVSEFYKGVTTGRPLSTATAVAFTDDAIGQKPFAPVHLRAQRDSLNNVALSWTRRTRKSTRFASSLGISCPLGEAEERYRTDVYSDSGFTTFKRSMSSSAPLVLYPVAWQTADYGSVPGTLYVQVYQIGSDGRVGYPLAQAVVLPVGVGAIVVSSQAKDVLVLDFPISG